MNRKYLNMHIDKATPKKWSKKEKLILTIEAIGIIFLFALFVLLLLLFFDFAVVG